MPPKQLLLALLLQACYGIRSEGLMLERIHPDRRELGWRVSSLRDSSILNNLFPLFTQMAAGPQHELRICGTDCPIRTAIPRIRPDRAVPPAAAASVHPAQGQVADPHGPSAPQR